MVRRAGFAALLATAACAAVLPSAANGQGILDQMQDEVASIVNRSRASIVTIEDERVFNGPRDRNAEANRGGRHGERDHGPPGGFAGRPAGEPPKVGSGFSIGDGFVVTTADVLSGMKNPMVLIEDGRRLHATVSGIDPEMNIGVLKLAGGASLPGLKFGRSSKVYPGHFAISIGNQYGHLNSVALTLVAGMRNDGTPAGPHFYPGLIQIAGTVGAGTSGAPILNARGEVIGMIAGIPFGDWTSSPFQQLPGGARPDGARPGTVVTTAASDGSGRPEGGQGSPQTGAPQPDPRFVFMRPPVTSAGFALPIDDMAPVLVGLRQGKVVHCWLGVDMKSDRIREEHNGAVTTRRLVTVSVVYPNSPASAAGLQVGDVLVAVNGRPVSRLDMIRAALLRAQPGEPMEIRLERKSSAQTVTARLTIRPEAPAAPPEPASKH